MKYIQRKKIKLATGEELDTGNQVIVMFVSPKIGSQGSDYEQQRTVYKALKYLRNGSNSECAIKDGDYIALEDAWYEHFMFQAKAWPWGINDPAIFEVLQEWEQASEEEPRLKAIK